MGNSVSSEDGNGHLLSTAAAAEIKADLADHQNTGTSGSLGYQYLFRSTPFQDQKSVKDTSTSAPRQLPPQPRKHSSPPRSPRSQPKTPTSAVSPHGASTVHLRNLAAGPSNLSDTDDQSALTDLSQCNSPHPRPGQFGQPAHEEYRQDGNDLDFFSDDESRIHPPDLSAGHRHNKLNPIYSSSVDETITTVDRYDISPAAFRSVRDRDRGRAERDPLYNSESEAEKDYRIPRRGRNNGPGLASTGTKSNSRIMDPLQRANNVASDIRMMIDRKRTLAGNTELDATAPNNELFVKAHAPSSIRQGGSSARRRNLDDTKDDDITTLSKPTSDHSGSIRHTAKFGLSLIDTVDTIEISLGDSSSVRSDCNSTARSIKYPTGGRHEDALAIKQCDIECDNDPCGFDESVKELLLSGDELLEPGVSRVTDVKQYMHKEQADGGKAGEEENVDTTNGMQDVYESQDKRSADPDGDYCDTQNQDQEVEAPMLNNNNSRSLYSSVAQAQTSIVTRGAPRSIQARLAQHGESSTGPDSLFAITEESEEEEIDMVFVRKYEEFFGDFLWLHPDIAGGNFELLDTLRAAKLKKMLEMALEAEATLEKELHHLQSTNKTSKYHTTLIDASREKAAKETQLQKELHTIQQATLVMEGRMIWQAIDMCYNSAKKQQKMLKDLFDKETDPTDMLELLPNLPETQVIRDAVNAPPGTYASDDKNTDLQQIQVDNAFLNAEVQLLEKKVAELEATARKHAWVDSVFLRLDAKQMKELRAEFRKKLGVVF